MVIEFSNEESDYENWCKEHGSSFVFNFAGGPTGNVLHMVGCRYLNDPSRIGTYTTRYPKYCSDDMKQLSKLADNLSRPHGWRRCKVCF